MVELIKKKTTLAADFAEASADYRSNPQLKLQSNCYSYALGIAEFGFGVPGTLKDSARMGFALKNITPSYIFNALMKDGLEPVRETELDEYGDRPIIACFIAYQNDYHFYLRHKDNFWSHQRGKGGEVSNEDNRGMLIVNPQNAWRGKYKEFVGYFALPSEGVAITEKKNWSAESLVIANAELKNQANKKLEV
tara:strand:+ start:102792 stop:103370 length:579 start_codon:yes stop_codon:yes gene_type:complete